MANQIWFITGSSRGFGRALVSAALQAGDSVVATARRKDQLAEFTEKYGDRVLPVALDVTDAAAVHTALQAAVDRFGRIDVLVNNAGYANVSPIETTTEEDFRAQFETNFWGVYNVSKAAIPILRSQGGGTVLQFSSIGGRVGGASGIASYQAAKFAVDGFSRCLVAETAPFGIKVLVVEPSGFATDWAGSSMTVQKWPAEYENTVGALDRLRKESGLMTAGDPVRAAEILVRVVKHPDMPSHLLLGAYAATAALDYSRKQLEEAAKWADVSRSADFGQPYPVDLPAAGKPCARLPARVPHPSRT
jgi:NAD(P)-dependent dehydrogenase (short-subunit alcohol dehydrogenase family)